MRLVAGMKRSRALHEGLVTAPGDDAATGGDDRALALHEQASRTQPTVWDAMGHDKGVAAWCPVDQASRFHLASTASTRSRGTLVLMPACADDGPQAVGERTGLSSGMGPVAVSSSRRRLHSMRAGRSPRGPAPTTGGREGGRARHRLLPRRRRELQPDAKQAAESPESPAAEAVEQAAPGHRERRPGTIGRDAAEGIGPWGSVVPHDPDPAMRQVASDENDSTGSGLLNRIGGEVRPEPSSSGMQTRTGSMDRRQGTPEEPRNREPAH